MKSGASDLRSQSNLNAILMVTNCSWCGSSFLWGKVRLPFTLEWINPSHGICPCCARKLLREVCSVD